MSGEALNSNSTHEKFCDGKIMGLKIVLPPSVFDELEKRIREEMSIIGIKSIVLKRSGETILLGSDDIF